MQRNKSAQSSSEFSVRLKNFRAFKDSGCVPIAPLTVLVGRNSSGKSSLLSMFLLLQQSLERRLGRHQVPPLALRGDLCDLGTFEDVVFGHNPNNKISFEFQIPSAYLQSESRRFERPLVDTEFPRMSSSRMYYPPYSRGRKGNAEVSDCTLNLEFRDDQPFGPSLSKLVIEAAGIGSVSFVRTEGQERSQHWRTYSDGSEAGSCLELHFYRYAFFPDIRLRQSEYRSLSQSSRQKARHLVRSGTAALQWLFSSVSQTTFIGPFRSPPNRQYAFSGSPSLREGISGVQAMELLIAEALVQGKRDRPLNTSINFWLKHLMIAKSIDIDTIAKGLSLFQFTLGGTGSARWANYADVGFGISQILPVIVQGMTSRIGGIFLVQQPEIHLHPDAQALLVDFFIYLACRGVRCVVETHSEYFLIRLRRRLAEGAKPVLVGLPNEELAYPNLNRDSVSVILSDSTRREGSNLSRLEIGQDFQFAHLPKGFMSKAMEDRLAILKATARGTDE